ncbi:MAG: transcriptional regulator [Candidatus Eisenbacteria bacterium]|nr:transcriptional regulator [Candidatus Eisenbacteria bacterium]
MDTKHFAKQLQSLAALDEPVRRRLYLYVVRLGREVGRDEAARAIGASRGLVAFHLDKLVEADLLRASFRRLSGRAGPGAGRPSKLYRRAEGQFDLSVPQRRYELAAHILAQALAASPADDRRESLVRAAREWGARLAADSSEGGKPGPALTRASRVLRVCGFEPRTTPDGEVVLGNCPFDSLSADRRELICGMNLALIEGLLSGLGLPGVEARLAPREGCCCVALRERSAKG